VHWHKLGEVENECILHNFIILAIFTPKIIKFSENLAKLWQNNFDSFFLRHGVVTAIVNNNICMVLSSSWHCHYESYPVHLINTAQHQVAADLWTKPISLSQLKWLHSPLPFITIQPESWYHPTECRRLSQPSWLVSYTDGSLASIQVLTWHRANSLIWCFQQNHQIHMLLTDIAQINAYTTADFFATCGGIWMCFNWFKSAAKMRSCLSLTVSLTVDWFSRFFHWYTQQKLQQNYH